MYTAERRQEILRRARTAGRVHVASLAAELSVTPETIRRDLAALARDGLVSRAHGGAIPVERLVDVEPEITARASLLAEEKRRIAEAALSEVPAAGAIFVESGSTPGQLAELLPADRQLTVVTTGLVIARSLATRSNLTVLMVGGRIRARTLAAVDDWAVSCLQGLRVDVAFLGTNGISADGGLTTPNSAEAAVKRAALRVGRRTVLLVDHTKLATSTLFQYGAVEDIDLLVTDSDHDELKPLQDKGIEVRIG